MIRTKTHCTKMLALGLTGLVAAACSSSPERAEQADTTEQGGEALLTTCQNAAQDARARIASLSEAQASGGEAATRAWSDFRAFRQQWEEENSPCARPGADVTERMQLQQTVQAELREAEENSATAIVQSLQEQDIEQARAFLRLRFATGQEASSELTRAAYDMSKRYNDELLARFRETEKYAQLDDKMATTCIFGRSEFDPQTTEIEPGFTSVFEGDGHVHALCRLPLPASKYAGDPDGKIVLVLDDDQDLKNGVIYEGALGTVDEWKEVQFFRGRFSIPQGIERDAKTAYFHVSVKVQRPNMGDEVPVSNGFYWFASR